MEHPETKAYSDIYIDVNQVQTNSILNLAPVQQTVTENGNYRINPLQSFDGIEYVDLTVDVPTNNTQTTTLSETITQNGEYIYASPPGTLYDSANITVSVPVPTTSPSETINITNIPGESGVSNQLNNYTNNVVSNLSKIQLNSIIFSVDNTDYTNFSSAQQIVYNSNTSSSSSPDSVIYGLNVSTNEDVMLLYTIF